MTEPPTYLVDGRPMGPIDLKAHLWVDGVRVDPSALEGVGTNYKEQIHGVFEFDEEFHTGSQMPAEMLLPDGTLIFCRATREPRFLLRREAGTGRLVLEKDGQAVTEVALVRRPKFYDQQTSDGTPMPKVGQELTRNCVIFCDSNYCDLFRTNDQCRFCNLHPTKGGYEGEVVLGKKASQIADTMASALEELPSRVFLITGGILPDRREIGRYAEILQAIKERTGRDAIESEATIAAPTDFKEIDLLAEAGYWRVNMNLEVWDKNIFAGICPGKARRIGWERWLEALEYAAARLGRGNVRSVFVSGIEPMSSFLEGVDYLASKGVFAFANPWCPDPGSLMEGHRPPYPFWHRELARKMVDTWQRHNLTLGQLARFAAIEGYLYYDEWRSRL